MLAIGRFRGPFPGHEPLSWITYYLAQLLIFLGIVRSNSWGTTDAIAPINSRSDLPPPYCFLSWFLSWMESRSISKTSVELGPISAPGLRSP